MLTFLAALGLGIALIILFLLIEGALRYLGFSDDDSESIREALELFALVLLLIDRLQ